MTFVTAERLRALRGVGGRVAFGVVVYLVAFYFSFPYGRIKEQVMAVAAQRDLDVEIASAGPLLGTGIAFHDIKISKHGAETARKRPLRIDEARVRVSLLSRIFGDNSVSVSADALGGGVNLDVDGSKTKTHVQVKGEELSMAQLPGVRETLNVPLAGKLGVNVDLHLVTNRMAETAGSMSLTCSGCALGDGKSKLKVPGVLEEGLDLPRIRLGDLSGRVIFDKGVGRLQAVHARSPDGEISVEGEIRLSDPLPYSQVDLYVRFKLSDVLIKGSDKLGLMMQLADSGKGADGYYGVRIMGSFAHLGPPQLTRNSPFAGGAAARPGPSYPGAPTRRTGFGARPGGFAGGPPTSNYQPPPPITPPPPPPPPARESAPAVPLTPPTLPPSAGPAPTTVPAPPVAAPGATPPPAEEPRVP